MDSIILMGIKHCGKSTQARLLSQQLNIPAYDTDDLIQEENGMSPRQIYSTKGESEFKLAEEKACRNLKQKLEEKKSCAVIATGGGICNNPEAVKILKSLGNCVFLQADEVLAADRIVREVTVNEDGKLENLPAYIAKKNPRSIQEVRDIFHLFYEERTKIYSEISDVTVVMGNAPKHINTAQILKSLNLN